MKKIYKYLISSLLVSAMLLCSCDSKDNSKKKSSRKSSDETSVESTGETTIDETGVKPSEKNKNIKIDDFHMVGIRDNEKDIDISMNLERNTITIGDEVYTCSDEEAAELYDYFYDFTIQVIEQQDDYWPHTEEYPDMFVLFEYSTENLRISGGLCYPDNWDNMLEYVYSLCETINENAPLSLIDVKNMMNASSISDDGRFFDPCYEVISNNKYDGASLFLFDTEEEAIEHYDMCVDNYLLSVYDSGSYYSIGDLYGVCDASIDIMIVRSRNIVFVLDVSISGDELGPEDYVPSTHYYLTEDEIQEIINEWA